MNDDYKRTMIGPTAKPSAEEQHIVPMVPVQVVRSVLNQVLKRAVWVALAFGAVGLAIGGLVVFLVMRPSTPTA